MACTASATASRMKVAVPAHSCTSFLPHCHYNSHLVCNENCGTPLLAAAIRFLGNAITPESIGNLNFLAANPEIANFETGGSARQHIFLVLLGCMRPSTLCCHHDCDGVRGRFITLHMHQMPLTILILGIISEWWSSPVSRAGYQYLVIVFFLVVFPLTILIRSFASTVTILYAWRKAGGACLAQPLRQNAQ